MQKGWKLFGMFSFGFSGFALWQWIFNHVYFDVMNTFGSNIKPTPELQALLNIFYRASKFRWIIGIIVGMIFWSFYYSLVTLFEKKRQLKDS